MVQTSLFRFDITSPMGVNIIKRYSSYNHGAGVIFCAAAATASCYQNRIVQIKRSGFNDIQAHVCIYKSGCDIKSGNKEMFVLLLCVLHTPVNVTANINDNLE